MKKFFSLVFILFLSNLIFFSSCKDSKKDAPGEKVYRIAFAGFGPDEGADFVMNGFISGLAEQGFIEGKNLEITKFHASGEISNIAMMMKNTDDKGFDVISPMTTPCLTGATSTIKKTKMVFAYVYDPIAAGAGKSFTDHQPNLTGVGSFPPLENTIDFIQAIVPKVKRIGMIYNNAEANSRKVVEVATEEFKKRGLELIVQTISGTNEIAQTTQSLVKKDIQVMWVSGDNTVLQALEGVVKYTNEAKLPLVLNDADFVGKGAVGAVGISWQETGIAASKLTARVLRGEDPSKIPFENVAVKKIVLNQKAANNLGIIFPPDILKDAEILK